MKDSDLPGTNLLPAIMIITVIDIVLILDLVRDLVPTPDQLKRAMITAKIIVVLQHPPTAPDPIAKAEMLHTRMLSPAPPKTSPWMTLSTHLQIKERAKKHLNKPLLRPWSKPFW